MSWFIFLTPDFQPPAEIQKYGNIYTVVAESDVRPRKKLISLPFSQILLNYCGVIVEL